ncbi:MAG: hypothetical protein IJ819_05750 [Clostridiales bacterium]|nr:hypothetical protein [Clostridiales bacterium]
MAFFELVLALVHAVIGQALCDNEACTASAFVDCHAAGNKKRDLRLFDRVVFVYVFLEKL